MELFEAELIMVMNHDPKPSFQILQVPHAHGFSDQTGDAISPFVVEAFDYARLAAAFVAGAMLPRSKELGVSLVEVGINQFSTIRGGHLEPQLLQRL